MPRHSRKAKVDFLLSVYGGKNIRIGVNKTMESMPSEVLAESPNIVDPASQYDAALSYAPSEFKYAVRFSKSIAAGQTVDVMLQDSDGDQIAIFWSSDTTPLQIKLNENPFLWVDPTKPCWVKFPRTGNAGTKISLVNPTAAAVFFTLITYSGKLELSGA